jgi:2-polyprenyl-6-methoxyphenol hydroxylase-like FAD-dependent oxidoreductase
MIRTRRSEALVVGAGPVGLFAALCLARRDIEVEVIDENPWIDRSSEPLVLGPRAIEHLDSFNLVPALEAAGRRTERIVIHEGDRVKKTLDFSTLPSPSPFLLVTPRSVLRETLVTALEQTGADIHWGHRLRALANPDGILRSRRAEIDELEHVSAGYAVTTVEAVIKRQSRAIARMVIGADGRESMVRQAIKADFFATSDPEILAVCDLDEESQNGENSSLHIVLHQEGADVVWPRPGGGLRWMGLVSECDSAAVQFETHLDLSLEPLQMGTMDPGYFERVVTRRAPWLGRLGAPSSARAIKYQRRRAEQFGNGLVRLIGDAAHLAGPLASQSENIGLDEARDLGRRGADVLHGGASAESLDAFQSEHRSDFDALGRRAPNGAGESRREGWLAACIPIFGEQRQALFTELRAAAG